MNRIVHILLIAAVLAPLCGNAYGETMAERKQRIMRKYLRERQDMVQSDMVLPSSGLEDERITASEKYKEVDLELNRQPTTPVPAAPVVRRMPARTQQNWMLEENPDVDPFADPFAMDSGEDLGDNKPGWWAQWQMRQEEMAKRNPADSTSGSGSTYGSSYGSGGQTGYGAQQGRPSDYTYGSTPRTTYGQQPDSNLGPYATSLYGSSSSDGMLRLPSPSQQQDPGSTTSGYTPYKSPYQSQQEQRRQQQGQQQHQQDEFTKPAPYQQWKDKNKQWDPTADDAYLDDLMRRNRQ